MAESCARCGNDMRLLADMVEVRREYRSLSGLRRLRTWRVALICRACFLDETEHHDFPNGHQGEQVSLW